jgi:hypothetical protein
MATFGMPFQGARDQSWYFERPFPEWWNVDPEWRQAIEQNLRWGSLEAVCAGPHA